MTPARDGNRVPGGDAFAHRAAAAMRRLFELGHVDPRSACVHTPAGRMHGIEVGDGPPLLLIHGASGGVANWYRLLGPLSERFRVVAPDLPGFGLSDEALPTGRVSEWTAGRVLDWLDAVGWTRGDVIATSFGGHVALRLAQLRADRFQRLVLLNSTGLGRRVPTLVRLASLPGLRRSLLAPSRSGTRILFRWLLTTDRSALPPSHADALVDYLYVTGRRASRTMLRSFPRLIGASGQKEVLADHELRALSQRVLLLWGQEDRFLPSEQGAYAAEHIPDARFEQLREVGHSPNWERPDLVLPRVLDFLASSDRT